MKVIICSSPFHILLSFALKEQYYSKDEVSILLMNYSADADKLYVKLKETSIFKEIYFVKDKKLFIKYNSSYIYRVYFLKYGNKLLDDINFPWRDVDELIYPYHDPILYLIARNQLINNIKCKYSYYDDGTAAYVDYKNALVEKAGKIETLFNVPLRVYRPDRLYLVAPNIFDKKGYCNIIKLTLPKTDEFVNKVNDFFGYVKCEHRRYIFFDQCTNVEGGVLDNEELAGVFHFLKENFHRHEIYIKKHPKRKKTVFEENGWDIFPQDCFVPFEVCLLNEKVDNLVLISDFSTATIMPKLLFESEPTVVYLYKVLSLFKGNNRNHVCRLVDKLKCIYKDTNKIIVPSTFDEFLRF